MANKAAGEVRIGKFDILATYAYTKALLDGLDEDDAKVRGIVAAVMGAKARLRQAEDGKTDTEAAEKKKGAAITAATFDRQVADKMGGFFAQTFLPGLKRLVREGLSYDEVKRRLKMPATWGAKISGGQFQERSKAASKKGGKGRA